MTGHYTEKLSVKSQMDSLGTLYSDVSTQIDNIQKSNTWIWGTNWDSVDIRYRLIINILQHNNIEIPSREKLIKIINDFEAE